jgi:hypothetical protein
LLVQLELLELLTEAAVVVLAVTLQHKTVALV